MSTPTVAELLHLVDRAERGSLLAEEAVQLRAGIRALGAARELSEAVEAAPEGGEFQRDSVSAALRRQRPRLQNPRAKPSSNFESSEKRQQ